MEIDTEMLAKLAEVKKQLETISGKEINASEEQLVQLFYRVSLSSYNDGSVMSRSVIIPGKNCVQANLLDVSSRTSTGADGKGVFLLTDFICTSINSFSEPVSLVVTPNTATPCYATMTHTLLPNPNAPGAFNDLQITVFTWNAQGAAAPNISFDWRCRLFSIELIL